MSPIPIRMSAEGIDLSPRFFQTATVTGSPAAAAETVIATLSLPDDLTAIEGVMLWGYASLTVGTDGASILTRLRRDSVSGSVIKASGATTATAAQLVDRDISGFDTGPTFPNEVYVMTLVVGSASAASTVSAVTLAALVV